MELDFNTEWCYTVVGDDNCGYVAFLKDKPYGPVVHGNTRLEAMRSFKESFALFAVVTIVMHQKQSDIPDDMSSFIEGVTEFIRDIDSDLEALEAATVLDLTPGRVSDN